MAPPKVAGPSTLDRLPPLAKVGLGLVFMALFGALYFVIFYADIETELGAAEQRNRQLGEELKRHQESKDAYQKDLDEKTRREQLARDQKKILPDEAETPALLTALQSTATISGVNLTSWSPVDEAPQQFFAKVPMKLTLTGKFHQVAKFFHGVGQLDRIVNIENVQLKTIAPKEQGDEILVQVECLATAFRSVREGEPAAAPGAKRPRGGAP